MMSEGKGTFEDLGIADGLAPLIQLAVDRYRDPARDAWFRGQQDVAWQLRPSVMRSTRAATNENHLLAKFMTGAPSRYPDCPAQPERTSGGAPALWLSLARQYGLLTRLLDWSHSILVAAFFATKPDPLTDDVDGAIWVLDPAALNLRYIGEPGVPVLTGHDVTCGLVDAAIYGVLPSGIPSTETVVATAPPQTDVRLVVQQCEYTIHVDSTPLEESAGDALARIVIPKLAKRDIYDELRAVGIRESALFPDLEHLAKELGEGPPIKD